MDRKLGRCDRVTWRAGGAATAVNADALAIGVCNWAPHPRQALADGTWALLVTAIRRA